MNCTAVIVVSTARESFDRNTGRDVYDTRVHGNEHTFIDVQQQRNKIDESRYEDPAKVVCDDIAV